MTKTAAPGGELDAEELLLAIDDAVRRFALAHVDQGPIER